MSGQSLFKCSSSEMTLNVGSLKPLQLSRIFNIPVGNLMLQDKDKNAIFADVKNNVFDSILLPNKVYDVTEVPGDNNRVLEKKFSSLIPSETDKTNIVQNITEHSVISTLNGPAVNLSKLVEASASIEYLIVTAATASDYTLVSSPVEEFQFLKHPKSMKVSVTQAAQEMCQVIQKNKSDMDAINLKMSFVSEQFKYIMPAIWTKNDRMVKSTADKMSVATDECVKKTDDCANRCEHLVNLIKELLTALVGAQSDMQNKDSEVSQNLKRLEEHIKLVQQKHDRRKKELEDQQRKFDSAWADHREQQKRTGSLGSTFAAGWVNILSFGTAGARGAIDTAHKNATANKKDEKDMLMQFKEKFSAVEEEMMNLKINLSKDKVEKEGLKGILEAMGEAIKRIGDIDATVQNMQNYFQTIKNLVTETFQANAQLFIEHAKNDNTTPQENIQMMEAVLKVYSIFFVVQSFATIYSIAASSEKVAKRLSRATKYLGLTQFEACAKQQELSLEETEDDTKALKDAIELELEKRTQQSASNITGFLDNSIRTATQSIQN